MSRPSSANCRESKGSACNSDRDRDGLVPDGGRPFDLDTFVSACPGSLFECFIAKRLRSLRGASDGCPSQRTIETGSVQQDLRPHWRKSIHVMDADDEPDRPGA